MNEQNNNNKKGGNTALIIIISLLVAAFIALGFLIYHLVNLSHGIKDVIENSFDTYADSYDDSYNIGSDEPIAPEPDYPEDFEDFEGDPEKLSVQRYDFNGQDIEVSAHVAHVDVHSSSSYTDQIEIVLYESDNVRFDIFEDDGDIVINEIVLVQDIPIFDDQSFISISLPEGYDESLELTSTSGDIYISELYSLDEIDCDTVSGQILVEDSFAQELDASSVSGNITVDSSEIEDCELDTTSGFMEANYCNFGKIAVASISGSSQLEYSDFSKFQMATTSGDCIMSLYGPKSDYSVEFASFSGKLHGHGFEGGSKQIQFASTSGNLHLTCE